jgi:beta-galactosidase/beta-glucuronidase
LDSINRDYNHPCIIAWTPVNESWGVPDIYADKRQQATAKMLYHLAKAADGTRFVSTNDGWEQVTSDICALHDYSPRL